MSDCSTNAFKTPQAKPPWNRKGHRWDNVEFHTPDGRTVWARESDEPCSVSIKFTDGTERWMPIALGGREISHFEVDGKRYEPIDWNFIERYDHGACVAIEVDGVRYVRARERNWDEIDLCD
jgi:hypothetical protein